jgi:hypothetical protein
LFRADAVAANDPEPIFGGMLQKWRRNPKDDPFTSNVAEWKELQAKIAPYLESIEVSLLRRLRSQTTSGAMWRDASRGACVSNTQTRLGSIQTAMLAKVRTGASPFQSPRTNR